MIQRIRRKFILVAMISLTIVLAIIIGGINVLNYRNVLMSADRNLKILSENDGVFPEAIEEPQVTLVQSFLSEGLSLTDTTEYSMSSELAYDTRYFSVVIGPGGPVKVADTGRVFSVDTYDAIQYAQKAIDAGESRGFIDSYRFLITEYDNGDVRATFYDCGRSLNDFRVFRNFSIIVAAGGIVVVFLMIYLLSGLVVRPIAKSYEKQKQFITDAGHEIKTPLAIISADTDVLEMDVGEDNEWITDIKAQTSRLAELTNDLIMLSKMEEGSRTLQMETTNLSNLVSESVESFETFASTTDRKIVLNITPDIEVMCDSKKIEQVMSVLMSNAIKYSPEGSRIDVKLSANTSSRNVQLVVSNVPVHELNRKEMDHVFDRFYRMDKSRNSETGGHGIGLSIAKAIVEAHRGKIAASVDGEGRFVITVTLNNK